MEPWRAPSPVITRSQQLGCRCSQMQETKAQTHRQEPPQALPCSAAQQPGQQRWHSSGWPGLCLLSRKQESPSPRNAAGPVSPCQAPGSSSLLQDRQAGASCNLWWCQQQGRGLRGALRVTGCTANSSLLPAPGAQSIAQLTPGSSLPASQAVPRAGRRRALPRNRATEPGRELQMLCFYTLVSG